MTVSLEKDAASLESFARRFPKLRNYSIPIVPLEHFEIMRPVRYKESAGVRYRTFAIRKIIALTGFPDLPDHPCQMGKSTVTGEAFR